MQKSKALPPAPPADDTAGTDKTQLVPIEPSPWDNLALLVPPEDQWARLKAFASDLIKTNMLPVAVDTPEKAALVILKGREVGLPPLMSLSEVYVVRGRAGLTAMAYATLLRRHGVRVEYPVHTAEKAVCRLTRRDGTMFEQTFSMADASKMYTQQKKDGGGQETVRLSESFSYRSNPEEMMMNRAVSRGARRFCPDVVGGMAMADEVYDEAAIDTTATPAGEAPSPLAQDLNERLRAPRVGEGVTEALNHPEVKPLTPEKPVKQGSFL